MSVIVNDFEIVTEPPRQEPASQPPTAPVPPRLTPDDVCRIVRRQAERRARVLDC